MQVSRLALPGAAQAQETKVDQAAVDRALELYAEMLPMDEHVAATVTNRVLARHGAPPARRVPGATGRYGGVFREAR